MRQPNKLASAILVVEDDESLMELVKVLLEKAGYAVFIAGDGDAGLALFQQYQPAISLVLTDVEMPRMNGLEESKAFALRRPAVPRKFHQFMRGNLVRATDLGCLMPPRTSRRV